MPHCSLQTIKGLFQVCEFAELGLTELLRGPALPATMAAQLQAALAALPAILEHGPTRHIWEQLLGEVLAPLQQAAASWVEAQEQEEEEEAAAAEQGEGSAPPTLLLERARALGSLRCGNLRCPNLAGAAEAEVRSKLCRRCCSVRYCGAGCQRVDWAAHRRVCGALAAQQHGGGGLS